MKTTHKPVLSILVLVGTIASTTFAGPPPDFWLRRSAANTPAPAPKPAKPTPAPDVSELKCAYMVVPNNGTGFSKSPVVTVRCTPAMLKNSWQCQQACARASGR